MKLGLVCIICALLFHQSLGNTSPGNHKAAGEQNTYNFDVTGKDFQNTQTNKLCLLARLNASITIANKVKLSHVELEVPEDASKEGSFCDFNYVSQLQLHFGVVTFALVFKRDEIDNEKPQQVYCNKCDNGHWHLNTLKVSISDASRILDDVPPTKVIAEADGSVLSPAAGGQISHISLQRGYRCNDENLHATLEVTDAYNLYTSEHSNANWTIIVSLNSINVQPFLVTNDIIKDPLLCKDVSMSIFLIITMPIVYFTFFIVCFRLKDKQVFKRLNQRFRVRKLKNKNDINGKKPLLKSSFNDTQSSKQSTKLVPAVSVTCTSPEGHKGNVI